MVHQSHCSKLLLKGVLGMTTLKIKSTGPLVERLQKKLQSLGYPIGSIDGDFGKKTQKAVKQFQRDQGLYPDGIVGRQTHAELGLELNLLPDIKTTPTIIFSNNDLICPPQLVYRICHDSSLNNIVEYWPLINQSLKKFGLAYKEMILMAIATVYVETGKFAPIDEYVSKYNTSSSGHPFDKYDDRRVLGNKGKPDGARYKGRGYIQLTGRANYKNIGRLIGLANKLEREPELANDAEIAADILACYLKQKEERIKAALKNNDLADARKAVNGGSHGLAEFKRVYNLGNELLCIT
jgi:peptidoglycan L-alanyl-D-glutamate endopeptidase CwlK